jgi:hypothetical protein
MKNGLVNAVIGTGVVVFAASAIRCASVERQFPKGMISGIEYQTLDQSRVPYKLEEHIIFRERQYFYKTEKTPLTLPFEILDNKDIIRVLDLDSKKVKLKSDKKYIPVRVRSDKGKKDIWVDRIELRRDGNYGTKAYMLCDDQIEEMAKSSKNKFGYKVVTTENGASFAIRTIKILGEEYFLARVKKEEMNKKGKKNYNMIPVKGAEVWIKEKCGNVYINNKNKVYRPVDPEMYPELFETPKEEVQTKKTIAD